MGVCGSTLRNTEIEALPGEKEVLAKEGVKAPIKVETDAVLKTNPLHVLPRKPVTSEGVDLNLSHPSPAISAKDELIDELQLKVKQQRALMHEGRNVRAASLGHLQASMKALKQSMDELRALLLTNPPEELAIKLKNSLAGMERAYHLQQLSQASELYTSIIENYLLSPADKEEFALVGWVNSMIDMLSSEALVPIKKAGILASSTEYIVHGPKAVLLYSLVNLMQNAIKFTKPKLASLSSKPLDITVSLVEEGEVFGFL